jgi:xanthine dehydrogenase large subunit
MLAISVREAIRDAVSAFGCDGDVVSFDSPATPERVFFAVSRVRSARLPLRMGLREEARR